MTRNSPATLTLSEQTLSNYNCCSLVTPSWGYKTTTFILSLSSRHTHTTRVNPNPNPNPTVAVWWHRHEGTRPSPSFYHCLADTHDRLNKGLLNYMLQVVKVIWHKATSPPQTDGSVVFARWANVPSHEGTFAQPEDYLWRALQIHSSSSSSSTWQIRLNLCFLWPT